MSSPDQDRFFGHPELVEAPEHFVDPQAVGQLTGGGVEDEDKLFAVLLTTSSVVTNSLC